MRKPGSTGVYRNLRTHASLEEIQTKNKQPNKQAKITTLVKLNDAEVRAGGPQVGEGKTR